MTSSLVPPARTAPLTLGFLTFVPFGLGSEEPAKGLRHGLELFDLAESLGYDFGWVRVRHFETYLSSPLTVLSAVSQRTERIHLGTAVIPARYESPIRLAEDAATVDLLSGGRLELGLSTGLPHLAPVFDGVFGGAERDFSGETQDRIRRVREALAGEVLGIAEAPLMSVPAGSPLLLTPPNPGLNDRIWYGPGSEESAARSGRQGLNIQVSTLNTEETGRTFHEQQARQIRAYRAAFEESDAAKTRRPQVAAGRIVLPLLTPADEAEHRPFIDGYLARTHADGRPKDPAIGLRFSPVHFGSPAKIIDELLADLALAEADSLTITLPAVGSPESHRRVLEAAAEHIAPHL